MQSFIVLASLVSELARGKKQLSSVSVEFATVASILDRLIIHRDKRYVKNYSISGGY